MHGPRFCLDSDGGFACDGVVVKTQESTSHALAHRRAEGGRVLGRMVLRCRRMRGCRRQLMCWRRAQRCAGRPILLESLRREVEDAERGSGHRDRQLQHSSERAAATVSLRSMEASGGAGHEDHVIPSRAKLGGRRDFQLGVLRPKPFRTLRSNVPRRQTLVSQAQLSN